MHRHGVLLYTVLIFAGHTLLGLLVGIIGPTLVDLQYLLQSPADPSRPASINDVSFSFTFLMFGAMLGSFVSFAYKSATLSPYLNRQVATSLFMLLYGLATILTPLTSNLWVFYGLTCLGAFGAGTWNTASTTWLMEMWSGKRLASLLQAKQLMYGLGSILASLLTEPFLSGYIREDQLTPSLIAHRRANLSRPYALSGALETVLGLLLLGLYFPARTRYVKTLHLSENQIRDKYTVEGTDHSPEEAPQKKKLFELEGSQTRRRLFLLLASLIFAAYNLCEIGHLNFQNTYFQSLPEVNISAAEAAEISSITAASYTAGRGLSILTSAFLSSGTELGAHFSLTLLSFGLLFWSSATGGLALRLNSALLGFSLSAIIPAMLSFVNYHLTVDDGRTALFFVALRVPSLFTPFLIGPFIEKVPEILLYIDLASISLALATFGAVRCLICRAEKATSGEDGEKQTIGVALQGK